MGHRLSRIVTKTGDDGTTGLGNGTRVDKSHPRVAAYGSVDELNSALGLVLAEELPASLREPLELVQHRLFELGGELCIPGHRLVTEQHVGEIEAVLDAWDQGLPMLKEFILPGGTRAAAACHLARAVCRRAERETVALARREEVSATAIRYLNRLSDFLFIVARSLNREAGQPDVLWKQDDHTSNA